MRLSETVRNQPLLGILAATAAGVLLGGLVLTKVSRLVVVAGVGYVANELWHRNARLDIDELIARFFTA